MMHNQLLWPTTHHVPSLIHGPRFQKACFGNPLSLSLSLSLSQRNFFSLSLLVSQQYVLFLYHCIICEEMSSSYTSSKPLNLSRSNVKKDTH